MEKRPGHGKRVQNNQQKKKKNSHVNNRINTTKVTVICRKNNTEENYKNIGNEGASPSRDTAFLLCCCTSKAGTGKAAQVQQAMVLPFPWHLLTCYICPLHSQQGSRWHSRPIRGMGLLEAW